MVLLMLIGFGGTNLWLVYFLLLASKVRQLIIVLAIVGCLLPLGFHESDLILSAVNSYVLSRLATSSLVLLIPLDLRIIASVSQGIVVCISTLKKTHL